MASPRQVIGRRIAAAFIDLFAFWIAFWGVFLAIAHSAPVPFSASGSPNLHLSTGHTTHYLVGGQATLYWLVWIAIAFVWWGVLPGVTGGSPGKLILGLRVVREDGSQASIGRNMLRTVMWVVDDFPYIIPGLTGFVLILANKGRRVADLVGSPTFVVAAADAGKPVSLDLPAAQQGAFAAPQSQPQGLPPAGWYPDPSGGEGRRWWDGSTWTDHRA